MERYINPFVDYGFKKLFATNSNKDLLISFLNAIIDGSDSPQDPIVDLQCTIVEQIGDIIGSRYSYFDVYCQTRNGCKFIVEMQNTLKPFFKDRNKDDEYRKAHSTIQTLLRLLEHGRIPKKDVPRLRRDVAYLQEFEEKREKEIKEKYGDGWICRFDKVYIVSIMSFLLPSQDYPADDYFHRIDFRNIEDNHVFYDELTLFYIEMPKLRDRVLKLDTMRDKWLHALTYLCYYDEYPSDLQEEVFKKLFREARLY